MAADACGAGDVEIVVHVAVRTLPRRNRVRTGQRKARFCVIESRRLPGCGGVAGFASLREPATHVIRVGGSLEILQVTRHAGRAGQVVVVVDVAIGTLPRRNRMRARQHKVHRGMIETRRLPGRSCVALQAIRREIGSHVIRIPRALKIFEVAGQASRGGQVVVVVDVAIDALTRWHSVPARQQEPCGRVVKFSVEPVVTGMACVACRRELCGNVIGICGRLKILEVAGTASR